MAGQHHQFPNPVRLLTMSTSSRLSLICGNRLSCAPLRAHVIAWRTHLEGRTIAEIAGEPGQAGLNSLLDLTSSTICD